MRVDRQEDTGEIYHRISQKEKNKIKQVKLAQRISGEQPKQLQHKHQEETGREERHGNWWDLGQLVG